MKRLLKILPLLFFTLLLSSPTLAAPCPAGQNPYRPTEDCETETDLIHQDLDDYQLTCTSSPKVNVNFESDKEPLNLSYSSLPCVETDQYGNCTKYQTNGELTTEIYANMDRAQLGGFGANAQIIHQSSPDRNAQIYPFQALFDQPNTYYPATDSPLPKEAYRTYWRTTTFQQQAKAKAAFIRQNEDYPDIRTLLPGGEEEIYQNYQIQYFDKDGNQQTKDIKRLAIELANQSRCLLVVDPSIDFNIPFFKKHIEIRFCNYTKAYNTLKPDTKAAYDALLPLPFDNYRGYLAQLSQSFSFISSVYGENLPYLAALDEGLTNPQTGLVNLYSPQWINNQREGSLTNDRFINQSQEQQSIPSFLTQLQEQITSGEFDRNQCDNIIDAIYLPSPLTNPQHLALAPSFSQTVIVPVQITRHISYRYIKPTLTPLTTPIAIRTSSTWKIKGLATVTGKPIVIANNPAQSNINTSLSSLNQNSSSLYQIFTPSFTPSSQKDTRIEAPISFFDSEDEVVITTTNTNDNSSPVPRQAGQSHVDLCQLRNQWLIPSGQQDSTLDCSDPYARISSQGVAQSCSQYKNTSPFSVRADVYQNPVQFSSQAKQLFQQAAACFGISPKVIAAISTVEVGDLYSNNFDRQTEAYCAPSGDGCGSWGPFQFLHNKDGSIGETVSQRNQRDPEHPYCFLPNKCPNPAAENLDIWSGGANYGNAYNECHNSSQETNICSMVDSAYAVAKMVSLNVSQKKPYSDAVMRAAITSFNSAACKEGVSYARLGNQNYCEYGIWFNNNYDQNLNYIGN